MTPPAPITGSAKNAAMVSGPSREDQLLQVVGQPGGEVLLALAVVGEALVVRAVGVQDAVRSAGRSRDGWPAGRSGWPAATVTPW